MTDKTTRQINTFGFIKLGSYQKYIKIFNVVRYFKNNQIL